MKIACLQFNPTIGEVQMNQRRASEMLEKYQPGEIDILVLPEMAFTGYSFENKEQIIPYLEDAETGTTVSWAKAQALRLNSFVMVGYPQIVKGNPDKCYNSICFVDRNGDLIETYQKTFLFRTDESWAEEGPGFKSIHVPGLGKVGFGICMDLNPYKFEAEFTAYEFARFHLRQQSEIILCSMAWLSGGVNTVDYWCYRLLPLYDDTYANGEKSSSDIQNLDATRNRNIIFVASNRTGTENDATFCGNSCVVSISPRKQIRKLRTLNDHEETVMVVDVSHLL
ncbi:carbon-nitrogen hydrolase [Gigaspora rosea]|uniref:Carbon-nitrogen hydrolase n=1 Tax=Gigaspora rosea TaxID=44941 RepID=A0A397V3T7_9GLOM|nr:carbon-nitrogen hydrolase [Gigaspora rosea]